MNSAMSHLRKIREMLRRRVRKPRPSAGDKPVAKSDMPKTIADWWEGLPPKQKWSFGATAFLGAPLVAITFLYCGGIQSVAVNLLLVIVGMLMGWVIGIAITPYSSEEIDMFSSYMRAISTFVGGYVLAKADDLIKGVFTQSFFTFEHTVGVLLTISAFLEGLLIAFVYRRYIVQEEEEEKRKRKEAAKERSPGQPNQPPESPAQ